MPVHLFKIKKSLFSKIEGDEDLLNFFPNYRDWSKRKEGKTPKLSAEPFLRMSVAEKNEYLFQKGINFNEIENWQKRGIGFYWEEYEKDAFNPKTQEHVTATRNRLKVDLDLPMKEEYSAFMESFLE